jgi:hypothetical protein
MVITDIAGDRQGELEVRRPSSGVTAPRSILNACANEIGYLKMGTKTDSARESEKLAPCLVHSGVATVIAMNF